MDPHKKKSDGELLAMGQILMAGATVILFGVVVLILLFCVFAVLRRRIYLQLPVPVPTPDPSTLRPLVSTPQELCSPGLDSQILEALPTFVYTERLKEEGKECSVCLAEFEDGQKLRLLPKCNHSFHTICIDTWFQSHSNCPLCRTKVDASIQNLLLLQQPDQIANSSNDREIIISIVNREFDQQEPEVERASTSQSLPQISLEMSTRSNSVSSASGIEDGGQSSKLSRLHSLRRMLSSSRSRDGKVFPTTHSQSQAENGGELQN